MIQQLIVDLQRSGSRQSCFSEDEDSSFISFSLTEKGFITDYVTKRFLQWISLPRNPFL